MEEATLPSHPASIGGNTSQQDQTNHNHHHHNQNSDAPACRNAIQHTTNWKPSCLDRRQSWSSQDHQHLMHMNGIEDVQSGHQGFTEKN